MLIRHIRPIALIGGAGVQNFGDEVIVRLWLRHYARHARFLVFHGLHTRFLNETFWPHRLHTRFRRVRYGRDDNPGESFWQSVQRGLAATPEEIRAFVSHPAAIHLHGGGYLNAMWPWYGYRLGFAIAASRLFGCPLVATGIGMLPLEDPPDALRAEISDALEGFTFFELRDQQSYEFLSRLTSRAVFGLDDTFLGEIKVRQGGPRTLHLSSFGETADSAGSLRRQSPELFSAFERVLFWLCTPGDGEMLKAIRERHPQVEELAVVPSILRPLPVSEGDAMITARFHPHLLAARHGAHGLYRSHNGYYDVKHHSVVAVGSPFLPLEADVPFLDQLKPPARRADIITRQQELVARKRKIADDILSLI